MIIRVLTLRSINVWNVISDNNTHQKMLPKYANTAKRTLKLLKLQNQTPPQKHTLQKIIPKS